MGAISVCQVTGSRACEPPWALHPAPRQRGGRAGWVPRLEGLPHELSSCQD